jgi:hypothetical protein
MKIYHAHKEFVKSCLTKTILLFYIQVIVLHGYLKIPQWIGKNLPGKKNPRHKTQIPD